jgi:hypothetical protein
MIKTDTKKQAQIISFYSLALAKKNITLVKASRGGKHLRFSYSGDHKKLLNDILPCEITDTIHVISGKYRTEVLTLKKSIDGAKVGDQIYIVNAVTSRGELRPKELTPEKIGVATGKEVTRNEFKKKVIQGIDKLKVSIPVKEFMKDLMDSAEDKSGRIKSEHLEQISDSDINVIAKDFGEVSGAWWYLSVYDKTAKGILYPTQSNLRLIDYYATYKNEPNVAISAKAGKGAPPSIDAIAEVLEKINYTDRKKNTAKDLITAIKNNSVVDGIVKGSAVVMTPGWNMLVKMMGSNITPDTIEKYLQAFQTPDQVLSALDPLYKTMNRTASLDITTRIFNSDKKRNGLILSPLAYHLVDIMNKDSTLVEVLNEATKQINVSQLYINIYKSQKLVKYHINEFKDIKFKFEYNGNAGMPGLKKISFKAK